MYTEKTETTLVIANLDDYSAGFSVNVDHIDDELQLQVMAPDLHERWMSESDLREIKNVINKALRELKG